jgi:hypothetical protein
MEFEAPIPGMSLTGEPGKYPWERPPEMTDPEEVLLMHLNRLSKKDKIEDLLDMIELGVDIKTITEGILRSAVAEGIHTVDVSLLIGPVIHEYIKDTAEEAGVEYEEGIDNPEDKKKYEEVRLAKAGQSAQKFLKTRGKAPPEPEPEEVMESGPTEETESLIPRRQPA